VRGTVHEGASGREVQGPRRLAPTEEVEQPRRGGCDRRRHRQAREHDERRESQHDPDVGELLQDVVSRAAMESQPQVIAQRARQLTEIVSRRHQIATDAPAGEQMEAIDQAVDDEHPREEVGFLIAAGASSTAVGDRSAARARGDVPSGCARRPY
jgi:hypothetical protein